MPEHLKNNRSQYRNALDYKGQVYLLGNPLEELESLAGFMKDIILGDEIPYTNNRNGKADSFRETVLGRRMKALSAWVSMYDGDLAYSPEIQHFFNVYRSHSVRKFYNSDYIGLESIKEFNKFADDLREMAHHEEIKKKTKNWRRNFVENKNRVENYVSTLCDHYAHLMVINFDFRYHKSTIKDESHARNARSNLQIRQFKQREAFMNMKEDDKGEIPEAPSRVGLDEISNDWERLKTNMRGKSSLFRHLVGYLSRFKFTSHGGYHLQLAVLYDGSKIGVDQRLADNIGKYWTNLTKGRGYPVFCAPVRYPSPELGMDDFSSKEKRAFLLEALSYLIRNTELAKVKTATGKKLLRTGKLLIKKATRGKSR